jgi:hypothetical protein
VNDSHSTRSTAIFTACPDGPTPPKTPTAAKFRNWRIAIMRQRAHNLGTIDAPDAKAAEAEAVKLFGLSEEQRKRLLVWERE